MTGKFKIGFTLEYEHKFFPFELNHVVIGGFGATFNKRSIAIYKTTSACKGFFIRFKTWKKML